MNDAPDVPPQSADELEEVVGVRFRPGGPLRWYRAGAVAAAVQSWVVAEDGGVEHIGQVVVGRGQCLAFPENPAELAVLSRPATETEIPPPPRGAGQILLESLGLR